MGERIAFAIAAAGALGSALGVVTLRNPFQAAVALIGTLVSVALLFLLAAAPFVAAIQVIVYAGAIVVLFLFVIAYLGEDPPLMGPDRTGRWGFLMAAAVGVATVVGLISLLRSSLPGMRARFQEASDIGSPRAIGEAFVDRHALIFEATSLVLLVAALGAVLLARRAVLGERGR